MTEGRRAALLGFLVIALPALALVARMPSQPEFLSVLNEAAHAPVFGALAIVVERLLRRNKALATWQRYAVAFALAVAAGGLIEVIQPAFGRGAHVKDLVTDASGAATGLALVAFLASRRLPVLLIAIAAIAPAAWPVAEASLAYLSRSRQFPTLFGGFTPADRYFIRLRGVETAPALLPPFWARADDPQSLSVRMVGNRWPGVTISEPQPDWRGYSHLMIDLTNPGPTPMTLTLRVHDRAHDQRADDRFNLTFTIAPAERRMLDVPLAEIAAAPADRELDLSRVAELILFGRGDPAQVGRVFYVTRIWLE